MRFLTTTLLLFLLTTAPAAALTLDTAIDAALKNHQRIELFRANADQSKAAVGSARAAFLPRADINYSYAERSEDPYSLGDKSSVLSFVASINLFNGLSDYHNFRAAQLRAEGSDYRLQGTRADIVLETQQAYIELLRAAHSVATAEEGVHLLQRQKQDTELKFEYGLIARNDLLRVEVELSSSRQSLLQANGQQQIAQRQLERITGLLVPNTEPITDLASNDLQNFDSKQIDNYRLQMLDNRSELNYLRSELRATQRARKASKSGYFPQVDLSVSHEKYGDDLSPVSSNDQDNLLTLSASWNLFDGFAREKTIAIANSRTRAIAAELRNTEATLVLQLETALQNAAIADGRRQEARIGVIAAEENYRVTENRVQQQQATTVDLLDAQFLLTRSRNLEINARYDHYLSAAKLERILEKR